VPMDRVAVEIGRALRQARRDRGLTLKDVARLSGNRFRPTSVAGYERAERSISVERFCALARLYGVAPDRLLSRAIRESEGKPEIVIDVASAERLSGAEGRLVAGFVEELLSLRGEPASGSIVIRSSDLEILASSSGKRADALLEDIRAAIRESSER